MAVSRTIAVVTGSRADFGLLAPVMRAVSQFRALRLATVVTGVHLSRGTWRDVSAAGFAIDVKVPMQVRGRTGRGADVAALGRGITGLGRAFDRVRPDVVVVLGDRIEALAGACAASVGGIHLGHIHGGDRAEGVADEAMRHAISKLAHLHFAATATSRRRLVRMGEDRQRVFNVGSPAVAGLKQIDPAEDAAVAAVGLDPAAPYVILLQHPAGGTPRQEQRAMSATLRATDSWQRLVLAPNDDAGRPGVMAALAAAGVKPWLHLRREAFLALLKRAAALVGNSSAGLIEAAALRVATVNIGDRQAGREKPGNVVDAPATTATIGAALRRAVASDLRRLRHPYGSGQAPQHIARFLAQHRLDAADLRKRNAY